MARIGGHAVRKIRAALRPPPGGQPWLARQCNAQLQTNTQTGKRSRREKKKKKRSLTPKVRSETVGPRTTSPGTQTKKADNGSQSPARGLKSRSGTFAPTCLFGSAPSPAVSSSTGRFLILYRSRGFFHLPILKAWAELKHEKRLRATGAAFERGRKKMAFDRASGQRKKTIRFDRECRFARSRAPRPCHRWSGGRDR